MDIKFGFVGVVTSNMVTSLSFFRALGLDVPAGAEAEIHVDIELGNGILLALDTIAVMRMSNSEYMFPADSSRITLAFAFATPEQVNRKTEEMRSAGFTISTEPFDAFWGQRYATVLDHDGNHYDLFCPIL